MTNIISFVNLFKKCCLCCEFFIIINLFSGHVSSVAYLYATSVGFSLFSFNVSCLLGSLKFFKTKYRFCPLMFYYGIHVLVSYISRILFRTYIERVELTYTRILPTDIYSCKEDLNVPY